MESISKKHKITQEQMLAKVSSLDNIQLKLESAAGKAVAVETRMRLIGQWSELVRNELKELVRKNRLKESSNYWDCRLYLLVQAISNVFCDMLKPEDLQKLEKFRKIRNNLVHAEFPSLMKELGITPTGREISKSGERNILNIEEVDEAILSIDRNGGFEKIVRQANEVISILARLILSLASIPN